MLDHDVVSKQQWLETHQAFLAEEKELTKRSDELARRRLALPWTRVEKEYVFAGPQGKASLGDLFAGRSQLAVYHFMFAPGWNEGCPSCSFVTDHFDRILEHLHARDVTLVLVSRAPLEKLMPFQQRLGWRIPWFSSGGCDFNHDFRVSFRQEEVASGAKTYNLDTMSPYDIENPGLSFFYKDAGGSVLHTYSTYARGLDAVMGTYAILDRAPKGRDEANLSSPMAWVRYHDCYAPTPAVAKSCCHNQAAH
ncbi:MAG: DUF899 domain-containing protein [Pirellula sp.]|nr:DUF899 domain-containing protein [Pirellula sp.]